MFEPEVFRKQMYCFENVPMTLLGLFALPPQWFGPRGIVPPFPPSLRLWYYAIKIGKFSKFTNFQVQTSWISLPWTSAIFEHNTAWILHRLPTKVAGWRHFSFLCVVFVSLLCLPQALFRRGPVFVLQIMKLFRHTTSYFLRLDKFENNFWIAVKAAFAPGTSQ